MDQPYITTAACPDGTFYGAVCAPDDIVVAMSEPKANRSAARRWAQNEKARRYSQDATMVRMDQIRLGDFMDLQYDTRAHAVMTRIDRMAAEFEPYGVCHIEVTADAVLIGWEGLFGLVAYPRDYEAAVTGHQDGWEEE